MPVKRIYTMNLIHVNVSFLTDFIVYVCFESGPRLHRRAFECLLCRSAVLGPLFKAHQTGEAPASIESPLTCKRILRLAV